VEISIRDLAGLIARLCGFAGRIEWDARRPNGQPRRRLAIDRAAAAFGFRAHTPFEDGLRRTIAWFRAEQATARRGGAAASAAAKRV
jgi:GDP-L-fucose synthase